MAGELAGALLEQQPMARTYRNGQGGKCGEPCGLSLSGMAVPGTTEQPTPLGEAAELEKPRLTCVERNCNTME